jgi:hypothetical protein
VSLFRHRSPDPASIWRGRYPDLPITHYISLVMSRMVSAACPSPRDRRAYSRHSRAAQAAGRPQRRGVAEAKRQLDVELHEAKTGYWRMKPFLEGFQKRWQSEINPDWPHLRA